MSIPGAIGIVALAVAIAAGLMLLVRRVASPGGIYGATRGIGIYSAIQGSLGVLIAFMIVLAFQSYLGARSASQEEATAVLQMFRTAELFPAPYREQEHGQLRCYALAVIGPEWKAMGDSHESPIVDQAVYRIERTFAAGIHAGRITGAPASTWLSNSDERSTGRQRRLAVATPFVPTLLWLMLAGGAIVIFGFLLGFADRTERPLGQALIAAAPVAILSSGLVLVYFFDHPYTNTNGSIQPKNMERTLAQMEFIQRNERTPFKVRCPT